MANLAIFLPVYERHFRKRKSPCESKRDTVAEFSRASRKSSYFTSFLCWEALRRYEAINQFFHSRRRMPWRWRFLLRYVINQVLKGGTKKKCLGNSQWRKSCYIIRATVFKHFSCHHCFSRRTFRSIGQLLVFSVTLPS